MWKIWFEKWLSNLNKLERFCPKLNVLVRGWIFDQTDKTSSQILPAHIHPGLLPPWARRLPQSQNFEQTDKFFLRFTQDKSILVSSQLRPLSWDRSSRKCARPRDALVALLSSTLRYKPYSAGLRLVRFSTHFQVSWRIWLVYVIKRNQTNNTFGIIL